MRRLYISDLDGTLFGETAALSKTTLDTLNQLIEGGLCFTIATARTQASAAPLLSGLNLKLPAVLLNGTIIYDWAGQKYLHVNEITREPYRQIAGLLNEWEECAFLYVLSPEDGLKILYRPFQLPVQKAFADARRNRYRHLDEIPQYPQELSDGKPLYFTCVGPQERMRALEERIAKIPGLLCTVYHDVYEDNTWYLEIYSETASKKNGVRWLKENLGFEHVTAFGDNRNDLDMLLEADVGCAVANALPSVRQSADVVIGRNTEDGVARFLAEQTERRQQ